MADAILFLTVNAAWMTCVVAVLHAIGYLIMALIVKYDHDRLTVAYFGLAAVQGLAVMVHAFAAFVTGH